jgi:hypothetical protein
VNETRVRPFSPALPERNPSEYFDLVTVDGDHSLEGAKAGLEDVIPHLAVGQ